MIRLQLSQDGRVFRRVGEELHQDCVVKRVKHPVQIMIWGMISSKGMGTLRFVEGHMNSLQYIKIIDEEVVPTMTKWFGKPGRGVPTAYFMQDGAPCHTSRASVGHLQSKKIKIFPWPGNSPDCNPIENIWALLKRLVRVKYDELKSVDDGSSDLMLLKKAIIDVWHNDASLRTAAIKCCASMPKRITMLRRNKGAWTSY